MTEFVIVSRFHGILGGVSLVAEGTGDRMEGKEYYPFERVQRTLRIPRIHRNQRMNLDRVKESVWGPEPADVWCTSLKVVNKVPRARAAKAVAEDPYIHFCRFTFADLMVCRVVVNSP